MILLSRLYFELIAEDECATNNAGCAQNCTNVSGGYSCFCRHGFVLMSDEHGCKGGLMLLPLVLFNDIFRYLINFCCLEKVSKR